MPWHARFGWIFAVTIAIAGCGGDTRPNPASQRPALDAAARDGETRVLVAYLSVSGSAASMAEAVAEGARLVEGATVVVRSLDAVTSEELAAADAIAFGSPTYFAGLPAAVKAALDRWGADPSIDLTDKFAGAFSTGGGRAGGKEAVLTALHAYALSRRMIVAGPLYERGEGAWGELGATARIEPGDPGPDAGELESAKRLGERLAGLAARRAP